MPRLGLTVQPRTAQGWWCPYVQPCSPVVAAWPCSSLKLSAGLQVELLLTAGTFSVALIGVVAGIFGMNLNSRHQESYTLFIVVSSTPARDADWVWCEQCHHHQTVPAGFCSVICWRHPDFHFGCGVVSLRSAALLHTQVHVKLT